jgi:serine/threonine protein kinase
MAFAASETKIGPFVTAGTARVTLVPELSRYRLRKQVGEGGLGVVYLAEKRVSGKFCAVKVIRPDKAQNPEVLRQFRLELDVLGHLSHPNIVRKLDEGRTNRGTPYLVMEYVAGENLDDHIRRNGPLPPGEVMIFLRWICSALHEVHAHGLVHGDVKPANIMAPGPGQNCRTFKLIDFGLVRRVWSVEGDLQKAATGLFAGSPLYASPESHLGAVDPRSDIYSLGATAYFLLTGRPVFDEVGPVAAIVAHAHGTPLSVRSIRADVHPFLDAIILKCLQKEPANRFQTVEELNAALAEVPPPAAKSSCVGLKASPGIAAFFCRVDRVTCRPKAALLRSFEIDHPRYLGRTSFSSHRRPGNPGVSGMPLRWPKRRTGGYCLNWYHCTGNWPGSREFWISKPGLP